ncbi:MAG TPA: fibronectin type III domain-containing protein [Pyrinomonadaceae bacterium]
MSKRSKRKRPGGRDAERRGGGAALSRAGRARYYVLTLSAFGLLAVTAWATRYDSVRLAVGMRPLLAPAARRSGQGTLPLAKEYVYAGGRLVATEEPAPAATPTPTPAGPRPTGLKATATSASVVHLEWVATTGAIKYVVERRDGLEAQPVEITTQSDAASFDDALPQSGAFAYLYRVKAIYASGCSEYSGQDLATTVIFTDDPIPVQNPNTRIKAAHLWELRRAVEAVRALAGVTAPPNWSYPDPVAPPEGERRKIYLEDVRELRTRLDDALDQLGLKTPYPDDPPLARFEKVHAAHFEQIRERVK